jgi:7,8-dihydro-6-hydroxymethylpterin dimethyltransferase
MADFKVIQPETTYSGSRIEPLRKGLPKTTQSLCPECTQLLPARIFEEDGRVIMQKSCPTHGEFRDIVFSDVRLYLKMEEWTFGDSRGLSNPPVSNAATRCPDDCGLCNMHTSHTGLANIDLTNRCNLTCPVCFANANAAGYVYEPNFEQIRGMLQALRDEKPVAGRIVQFSGGEPTIYPRFFDVLRMARDMGFSHLQIATNGLKFTDLEFAQQAKEAGLHTLYLQFDGVCDDIYRRTRGRSLWEQKLQAIENVRKANLKIVFVPTIVKGLNDHQIGDIIRLALENIECTSGISFQPVAFTGTHRAAGPGSQAFHAVRFRARGEDADRHLRSIRRLVPAGLRLAVLKAAERHAGRADHHADLPSALLAGHIPLRGPEPARRAGHAIRGCGTHAAGHGHAGPQDANRGA